MSNVIIGLRKSISFKDFIFDASSNITSKSPKASNIHKNTIVISYSTLHALLITIGCHAQVINEVLAAFKTYNKYKSATYIDDFFSNSKPDKF
jgi:hypothetical protein